MMINAHQDIVFEFLSDDPEIADGFSGGGHQRSARTLANAVAKFSNDDRSIGLEGTWGSGKTTVVNMAEKELGNSHPDRFSLYTFDLWANQSIEFRRAFLEDFLSWSKQYVDDRLYKAFEKRVQGKTKIVETESQREFSVFGYILMCALFVLPFLVLWLSPFSATLHNNMANLSQAELQNLPWIFQQLYSYGHSIALAIVILVIVSFIIQVGALCWNYGSLRTALDRGFSLFIRKSNKDTVTQTIRDGDPTKYEFHEIFYRILSRVQGDDRRVVFVFDNIDRLPANQIQETWSNVRSIFSRDISKMKKPSAVVTAIVPYDRAHVLSAFDDADGTDERSTVASSDEGNRFAPAYVREDVFRKTFSAIVSIAPPITSDVQLFFDTCLERALPGQFGDGQKYRLFQIFDTFLIEESTNPTPRQIKAFVNEVGMLWHQWQGSISAEAIAIFVLHRSKLEASPKILQDPETIGNRYRHFAADTNIDRELAALAYNVEPEIALEVLLERDIVSGLCQTEGDRLVEVAKSPGFKTQLDRILSQHCAVWASSSLSEFETALSNYAKLELDPSVKAGCDRHFTSAIPQLVKMDVTAWEIPSALFQLVASMQRSEIEYHLLAIANWVKGSLPEEFSEDLGRAWINILGGFLEEVRQLHGDETTRSAAGAILIPYSPEFYVGVALDCGDFQLRFRDFQSVAEQKATELQNPIAEFGIQHASSFHYVWSELHHALKGPGKVAVFSKLLEHMRAQALDSDAKQRAHFFNNLVLVAAQSAPDSKLIESLNAALGDGSIAWHSLKANEANDWQTLAAAVWLASLALGTSKVPAPSAPNKAPFGDLQPAYDWFSKAYQGSVPAEVLPLIAELVISHDKLDTWIAKFAKVPQNTLYRDVLIESLGSDRCPAIDLKTLLAHYTTLKQHFVEEAVAALVSRVGDSVTQDEIDQVDLQSLLVAFVQEIGDLDQTTWRALSARVDNYLKALSREDWEKALAEDEHNRKLLLARGDRLDGVIPPSSLRGPLAEFVSGLLAAKDDRSSELASHGTFYFALAKSSRKGVSNDVFERMANAPVRYPGLRSAIAIFPEIFGDLPLNDQPDTAVSKLLIPLLDGGLAPASEVVRARATDWANCVKECASDLRSQLNDYFVSFEESEDESVKNDAEELRKMLKLRKPSKRSQAQPSDAGDDAGGRDDS